MSKLTLFLKDDATVVGDVATNTAGASGDTSKSKKKKNPKLISRLSENTIKFEVTDERGVDKLKKLQEKYPDAVFTYNLSYDIIGDVSGSGIIEVSDIWYDDLKTIIKDYTWLNLSD